MKKFIAWITSMPLAIGLISYLAVTCILATLVPQGLADEEYLNLYPRIVAQLVIQTGFGGFFGSILFIVPSFLFFANLSACTVKRLVAQFSKSHHRRFGPDILHIGLMILVLGSVWSAASRQEGSVVMTVGQSVNLPDGSVLRLDDFRFERYPDGRPRDWTSVVSIQRQGRWTINRKDIRVNAPLSYAGFTFYQTSYQSMPDGSLATGIEAVSDRGYPLVVFAFVLLALGISITFIQKMRDQA